MSCDNRFMSFVFSLRRFDVPWQELEFQRLAAELEDEHQELRAEARRAKRGADIVTPEMQADGVARGGEGWGGVGRGRSGHLCWCSSS